MSLSTSRLTLTPISQEDWPLFLKLHQLDEVMRFVMDPISEKDIKQRFDVRLNNRDAKANAWLTFTVKLKDTGESVGLTGFYGEWLPYKQAELGFLFLPEFQGYGYAKESTLAILDFIFNQCQYHKAVATVTEGNDPSFHLLQKLGFIHEGTLRDNYQLRQQWYNDLKLGLLHHEYTGSP